MTDQELLALLKTDAEAGLRELIKAYGSALYTICRNILREIPPEDIEEVVSDILVGIWKSRDYFEESRGTQFKSYCYGVARKTALKKRRECTKMGELIPLNEDILEDSHDFQNRLEKEEESRILLQVLMDSEEPLRSIFIFRYLYFYKVKEIAEKLKISSKQVENYLHRGKAMLKKELLKRGIEQ